MKAVLFVIYAVILSFGSNAALSFNKVKHGRQQDTLLYVDTVMTKGMSADELFINAQILLEDIHTYANQNEMEADEQKGKVITTYGRLIKGGMFNRRPMGEIRYNIEVWVGINNYVYHIDRFRFVPYKRNRYGRHEPDRTGVKILKKSLWKDNEDDWQSYKQQAIEDVEAHIRLLKEKMTQPVSEETEK